MAEKNPDTTYKTCAADGCDSNYPDHKWGATKAHEDGWFLQRNGDSWCPKHVPDWVAGWRAKQEVQYGVKHKHPKKEQNA